MHHSNFLFLLFNMSLRCLEWFSGIGGMHYGLIEAQSMLKKYSPSQTIDATIIAAFDINELANRTYEFNFRKAPITVSQLKFYCLSLYS
jgi:tRNA (cytosine38-C5)-methyltransferase